MKVEIAFEQLSILHSGTEMEAWSSTAQHFSLQVMIPGAMREFAAPLRDRSHSSCGVRSQVAASGMQRRFRIYIINPIKYPIKDN